MQLDKFEYMQGCAAYCSFLGKLGQTVVNLAQQAHLLQIAGDFIAHAIHT